MGGVQTVQIDRRASSEPLAMITVPTIVRIVLALITLLPVGQEIRFKLRAGERVYEVANSDPKVVEVSAISPPFARGVSPGISRIELTGEHKTRRVIIFIVLEKR